MCSKTKKVTARTGDMRTVEELVRKNGVDGVVKMLARMFEEDAKTTLFYPKTFAKHSTILYNAENRILNAVADRLDAIDSAIHPCK